MRRWMIGLVLVGAMGFALLKHPQLDEYVARAENILQLAQSNVLALTTSSTSATPETQTNRGETTGFSAKKLVRDARSQIGVTLMYDPTYTVIPYPGGDVVANKGVCTDVVIRAMRLQGVDLQKLVHEDMRKAFARYPRNWGLSAPDRNIDHRRMLNLEVFMQRQGKNLALSQRVSDFKAGDWVTWRVGDKKLPHIGIVSDRTSASGVPLIIHNIGAGTQEEDVLFAFEQVGHYRW